MLKIIAGKFRGRTLKSPKLSVCLRPSQAYFREAIFNICQHYIYDANFLDIFAGTGAVGFEALSRGASHVTFIERNKVAVKIIYENARLLGVENCITVMHNDAFKAIDYLLQQKHCYDIIFADPPYHEKIDGELFSDLITKIIDKNINILKAEGIFFMESNCHQKNIPTENLIFKRFKKFGESVLNEFTHLVQNDIR